MKQLLILPFLFTTIVHAATMQVETKVVCDTDRSIIEGLTQLKEQPIAMGKTNDDAVTVIITMNDSSKEWTVIAIQKNSTCILAAGKDLKLVAPKSRNTTNVKF